MIENGVVIFKGNICSMDGKKKIESRKTVSVPNSYELGLIAADEILANGGKEIMETIRKNIS
jgi:hydroxymethylbilane synthase